MNPIELINEEILNDQSAQYDAALISEAAYYLSEKRGFELGHEVEDWLQAEAQFLG